MNVIDVFLHSAMIERLGWTLVHSLWQGAAIAPLVGVALYLLKTSAGRYLAAMSGLVLMMLMAVVTFAWVGNADEVEATGDMPHVTIAEQPAAVAHDPGLPAAHEPVVEFAGSAAPIATPAAPLSLADAMQGAFPWLVGSWLIGVLALSLWHLGGWIGLQRLRKAASTVDASAARQILARLAKRLDVRRPVQLIVTDLVRSPIVLGFLRPMILVPVSVLTGLSQGQLEAILAHELAHVRRHDYVANLFQCAIETLLFYHPAVWWVSRVVRRERENCCDDVAAEICGDRVLYARALLSVDELQPAANALAMGANGGSLKQRIHRLLGVHEATRGRRSLPAALLVVMAILAAMTFPWFSTRGASPEAAGDVAATATAPASAPAKLTLTGKILLPDGTATADLALLVDASQVGVDRDILESPGTSLDTKDTADGVLHMTAPPSLGIIEGKPNADGSFSIDLPGTAGSIMVYAETDNRRLALYKKVVISGKDAKLDLGDMKLQETQEIDVKLTDIYGNPYASPKGVDIDPPGFRGCEYDMSKAMQGLLFTQQNRKFFPDEKGMIHLKGVIPGQTYNLQQASQINDLMTDAGTDPDAFKKITAKLNWTLVTLIPEKGPRPESILMSSQLPVRIVDEAGKPVVVDSIQKVQVATGADTAWTNGTPVVINDHLPDGWVVIDRVNIFVATPGQVVTAVFSTDKQKGLVARGPVGGDPSRLALTEVAAATAPATLPSTKPADKEAHPYTGDKLSIAEALGKSDSVVAGEITDAGIGNPDAPDRISYSGVTVKVSETLKGAASKELRVGWDVKSLPVAVAEIPPQKGMTAVFFLSKSVVVKVLPADAETIKQVKAAIEKDAAATRGH